MVPASSPQVKETSVLLCRETTSIYLWDPLSSWLYWLCCTLKILSRVDNPLSGQFYSKKFERRKEVIIQCSGKYNGSYRCSTPSVVKNGWLFKKKLEDISPFRGATDIPLFWTCGDVCPVWSSDHLWCDTCWLFRSDFPQQSFILLSFNHRLISLILLSNKS